MVDFAGWQLPVFYEAGALDEHHMTRRSVGLFDIDHMGQITVAGPDAVASIDRLVTSDIASLPVGSARYGLLCNDAGGVIDDVIVYRTGDDSLLVVVNAANRSTDLDWILTHTASADCDVNDASEALGMIAVQGPRAVELIDRVASDDGADHSGTVAALERFTCAEIHLFGTSAIVARTGYTGEDGVELYVRGGHVDVWTGILDRAAADGIDALPIGLGARDSLRFEPGYPLHGSELAADISPLEARLSWAVDFDGVDFIGRDALVAQRDARRDDPTSGRRLETIVMADRGVPRPGSTVLTADGTELGHVVSGMYAPTADVFAANVFLPRTHGAPGTELVVEIRGKHKACTVVKRPLYRSPL